MGRKESKQTNQHPVEYEKQLLYEENKKNPGIVMPSPMDLWYKYKLRKYSH